MSKIYEVEKGLAETSHVNARSINDSMKSQSRIPICSGQTGRSIHRLGRKVGTDIQNEYERGQIAWFLGQS